MLQLTADELPVSVDIADHSYPISVDFRDWIRVDLILKDPEIPEATKLPIICQFIGPELLMTQEPPEDLWAGIFSFYTCNRPYKEPPVTGTNDRTAYRFDKDWWLLYAAFRQQYGINLLTARLHWFEFRALMDGLTEDTQFIQVVQIRTRDTSKLKGEEKRQADRMERYWRIEDTAQDEERDPTEIEAELLAKIKD